MRALGLVDVTLALPYTLTSATSQDPMLGSSGQVHEQRHIAIIGAGMGGAAAAFDLYEHNRRRRPPRITVFEREAVVGGRIRSVWLAPSQGSSRVIELGATHFFTDDWCLTSAMQNVGLRPEQPRVQPHLKRVARRNRNDVRTDLKCNAESESWRDFLHGRWKYGSSWTSFHTAVRSILEKWIEFGSPWDPAFDTITEVMASIGIPASAYGTAKEYFEHLSIGPALQDEVVQPCTRARFSQDLTDVSGLSTLLAAGKSKMTSVEGGNSRLVDRLIRLSEADLRLNSVVTAVTPGMSKRYRLSVSHSSANTSSREDDMEFDMVILATPLENSEIDLSRFSIHSMNRPNPRMDRHVTHFSSSVGITSNLSILPLDVNVLNEGTLTTSYIPVDPHGVLNLKRTKACFRRGCLPGDECDECNEDNILYRIVSLRYVEDDDLVKMIGQDPGERSELGDYGIGFVRRQAWPQSYPAASNGRLEWVDDIEIAPSLYYLNGAESILNSMEMSCRMGRNAAKKLRVKWSPLRL